MGFKRSVSIHWGTSTTSGQAVQTVELVASANDALDANRAVSEELVNVSGVHRISG